MIPDYLVAFFLLATVFFLPLRVGESCAMADSTVATDVHQSLDVHLDGGAELTFDAEVGDDRTDGRGLGVVPVPALDGAVDAALSEDLLRCAASDSEDVGQAHIPSFVVG